MHQVPRYKKDAGLQVFFYGNAGDEDVRTAEKLVAGNGVT